MNNLREVNDDILKEWFICRDENFICITKCEADKQTYYLDELTENILNNIPTENKEYIKNELQIFEGHLLDYMDYWNEKYYRNGFCDGIEMIIGTLDK